MNDYKLLLYSTSILELRVYSYLVNSFLLINSSFIIYDIHIIWNPSNSNLVSLPFFSLSSSLNIVCVQRTFAKPPLICLLGTKPAPAGPKAAMNMFKQMDAKLPPPKFAQQRCAVSSSVHHMALVTFKWWNYFTCKLANTLLLSQILSRCSYA